MAFDPLAARQLDLIRAVAAFEDAPLLIGGYAEDAVLAGRVTRAHQDVDWLLPRSELTHRLTQFRRLGFDEFETWGEAAPGEPFYLYARNGDLGIDLGVSDEVGGRHVIRVHSLAFDLDGREPPVGFQVVLPDDTYEHPLVTLEGIRVRVASPLALYQLRVGIATKGSFGALSERHRRSSQSLRETFFPGLTEAALAPAIEALETLVQPSA